MSVNNPEMSQLRDIIVSLEETMTRTKSKN